MKYPLAAFLTFALSNLAAVAQAADGCDASQASMNTCTAQAFKRADDDLNRYYKAQMDYLKGSAGKEALRDAQRKWLAFRDADCRYRVGKPEEGGSMWPMRDLQCRTELTRQRAAQLKAYTECRGEYDQCPN
ncbi:lysozyme inhibitor LprI family protein [Pseudomonas sp. COR18]|uniref:lysozyme inhibitor LprI family protein n=1 Tax=Pseudomonas sp. COR18 TaxID=3399680 RepID=UPI003B003CBB